MKSAVRISLLLFLSGLWLGCQSVKISTGPPTDEQAANSSEARGKELKTEWYSRLNAASPQEKMVLVRNFADSTVAQLVRYGYRIADLWHDANTGSGREVPETEMRQVVENSTRNDLPLLESFEQTLEYGVAEILRTEYFDDSAIHALKALQSQYYNVYSAVFYPAGTVSDYEYRLGTLETETREVSAQLQQELDRF